MLRRTLLLLTVSLAAAVVVAPVAGKPPQAGGACSSPTLSGPTDAHVGDAYTIQACGFEPGAMVPIELAEANGCCFAFNMVADATGRFTYTGNAWAAGAYRVRAAAQHRGSGRWVVVAEWSFDTY